MKKLISLTIAMTISTSLLVGCAVKATETEELAAYTEGINGIELSEETRIVALGEATHGNREFQQLKKDVFAHLVETTQVRALALEADFGGCAKANAYILYDEGSAEDAVESLGFQIYRTDEMLVLMQWMHDYNLTAPEGDKVRFYGFDMQRDKYSIGFIKDFYEEADADKAADYAAKLDSFYKEEEGDYDEEHLDDIKVWLEEMITDMESNEEIYKGVVKEESYAYALQAARCLLQNRELYDATVDYNEIRDKYMAENVKWILEREENIYGAKLMLSGHNGHVAKVVSSRYTNMGYYLYEEMGNEYYVIGTDFYHTICNIADEEGRGDYEFCSDDPLAKAVETMDENICYLDFKDAMDSKKLTEIINNPMPTGSLGEAYSPMMMVSKSSYQLNKIPSELYDGMIFVYEATPIRVWDNTKE